MDIIILDLMLPKVDGPDVCRRIRQQCNNTSIIMLTAKGDDVDKIIRLELGADDYMVKSFSQDTDCPTPRSIHCPDRCVTCNELQIAPARRLVTVGKNPVEPTVREFNPLITLAQRPGFAFTREMLLEQVWGHDYYGDTRIVDVYIRRVREKIDAP